MAVFNDRNRLRAAARVAGFASKLLDAPASIRLWDGSEISLGSANASGTRIGISISGPEVLGSLLRRPTLENLVVHYARAQLDVYGGDLVDLVHALRAGKRRVSLRTLARPSLLGALLPLVTARARAVSGVGRYEADGGGSKGERNDQRLIQFHYDVGNDFYALFLDPEMQYSCAYFTDWEGTLEQAQRDKLEMICRKLRLQQGERFLDIGCGWGGLICYAAERYGVEAHGVTLSREQYAFARDRISKLGLEDRVSVELRDYREISGSYQKIASIGMAEHVGIDRHPAYFAKLRHLLEPRGLLLNHAITRRAKRSVKRFARVRPERRFIERYIFPGFELDHVGHTTQMLEAGGFEVHDVEGWREHYARTTRLWGRRLAERAGEARALAGDERARLWAAYLAGVSLAFSDGSLQVFQVLASKRSRGASGLPPTRADLYR